MDTQARRQAARDYKKRESVAGVYRITNMSDGRVWVGHTLNLDSIENRTRFTLRNGGHLNRSLQLAWKEHGEAAFAFDMLELLDEAEMGFTGDKALRERARTWKDRLGAEAV